VALTFDDGPYSYTPALLDTLAASGVKATFFVTGINGGKGEIDTGPWPGIIQRMVQEGHQVASHTWSHQDLTAISHADRLAQILRNEVALTNILGYFPTYLRPPYANLNGPTLDDLRALGYHVVSYASIPPTSYQSSVL
jgi:peptidoglycan/xylan/chitin deacetylase (PgdA/CDA1 family)